MSSFQSLEKPLQSDSSQSHTQRFFLYQIAYSDATWNAVPPNALPLDNRDNERSDWAEYWPIRRFLQNEVLDDNAFYAFISPRFCEKMLCTIEEVISFVTLLPSEIDVAAFSPFIDLRAIFLNVFEQAEFGHPGMMDLSQKVVREIMPGVDLRKLINTNSNGIFCNYFAAKPRFWRKWLMICESVFAMAESLDHPCTKALNRPFAHRGAGQAKVFVIERMASLLLATSNEFKTKLFKETTLSNTFKDTPSELIDCLGALKSLAIEGRTGLLKAFYQIQKEILSSDAAKNERLRLVAQSIEHGVVHAPSIGYEHWANAPASILYAQGQIGLGRYLRHAFLRK